MMLKNAANPLQHLMDVRLTITRSNQGSTSEELALFEGEACQQQAPMDAETKRKVLDSLSLQDLQELVKKRKLGLTDQASPPLCAREAEGSELLSRVLQQPELAHQIVVHLNCGDRHRLASCNRSLRASVKHAVKGIFAWVSGQPDDAAFSQQSLALLPSFPNLVRVCFCLDDCTAPEHGWFWSLLAQIPQLKALNLLSETLQSMKGLKALSGLSSLQSLAVTAPLRCISTITSLSLLTSLTIAVSEYEGTLWYLDSLMYLTGLRSLHLDLPRYQDVEATCTLSSLQALETLVLSGAVIDCSSLAPLTCLTSVNFSDCHPSSFENITALAQLLSFAAGWTSSDTPPQLLHVTALSRLTSLNFHDCDDGYSPAQVPAAYCTALGGLRELECELPFTECSVGSNITWTRMTALTSLTVVDLRPLDPLTSLQTLRCLTLQLAKAEFLGYSQKWPFTYLNPLVNLAMTSLTIVGEWPMGLPPLPQFNSTLEHLTLTNLILSLPTADFFKHLKKLTLCHCNLATTTLKQLKKFECEVVLDHETISVHA